MKGRVLSHLERKAPPFRSSGDSRLIHTLSDYVEKHVGPIGWVLHDLASDVVHLDILWVAPGPNRDFHTFVTCGMSERAMIPPKGWTGCRHAELLLRLPPTWKLGRRVLDKPRYNWPLRELEHLARMPHVYRVWLWAYHTVANGDPPEPLPGATGFSGSVLVPVTWPHRAFDSLPVDPGRSVHFFGVIPLYADELTLARDAGTDVLLDRMEQAGVTDLLDVDRPSVVGEAN
jgi:hypothetical protein